jgi:hypothetical protein
MFNSFRQLEHDIPKADRMIDAKIAVIENLLALGRAAEAISTSLPQPSTNFPAYKTSPR